MNDRTAPATNRVDAQHEILAEDRRSVPGTLPVTIEVPQRTIWNAAILQSQFPTACAAAFAAALAQKYNCPLLTGDAEFRGVDHLQIEWIGVK
jgi:predicted nucleic acid-binding protein